MQCHFRNILIFQIFVCLVQWGQQINQIGMKYNKNNGTLDLVPITVNVVNLEALKIICRKTSERYEKSPQKLKNLLRNGDELDIKKRQVRSNKIYYKRNKNKEKLDEIYFSDYKIKYGTTDISQHLTKQYSNANMGYSNTEQRELNGGSLDSKVFQQSKGIKDVAKNGQNCPEYITLGKIKKEDQSLQNLSSIKRKANTKMQKRKSPILIKMSFSYKNYKKLNEAARNSDNINQLHINEAEQKLDGWAIQSPHLYDIDKKLDITEYTRPDPEESRQYHSERKRAKQSSNYLGRIRRRYKN